MKPFGGFPHKKCKYFVENFSKLLENRKEEKLIITVWLFTCIGVLLKSQEVPQSIAACVLLVIFLSQCKGNDMTLLPNNFITTQQAQSIYNAVILSNFNYCPLI